MQFDFRVGNLFYLSGLNYRERLQFEWYIKKILQCKHRNSADLDNNDKKP